MPKQAIDPYIGTFEVSTRDAIVRHLSAVSEHWKWTVPPEESGNYAFQISRQSLQSAFIIHAAHSSAFKGLAIRDIARVCIVFVLAGEVEIYDRRTRQISRVVAGHVASIRGRVGKQLHFKPGSSWLLLQIPEARLQQHFEELSGKPYAQAFELPPTDFRQGEARGLHQILLQADDDLKVANPAERGMLARAYKELVLVKLFTRLAHNMTDVFHQSAQAAAPRQLLKAEAFMRENLYTPITLEDVVHAAACGRRALQRMFHTYRADTPTNILLHYRLAAAHGALRSGKIESVTDLAMSLQFSNPGRFSALYKRAYGSSPSSDLRYARKHADDRLTE
jgi:AraC-like DNA-binding protein